MMFFFNDTATTEIYTLSLPRRSSDLELREHWRLATNPRHTADELGVLLGGLLDLDRVDGIALASSVPALVREYEADRKSTRLNSSHANISYAVFCLKKTATHHASPAP